MSNANNYIRVMFTDAEYISLLLLQADGSTHGIIHKECTMQSNPTRKFL